MRLTSRKTIITGASRGIGRVMALMFSAQGAAVTIAARNEEELYAVKKEIESTGGVVYACVTDMQKKDEVRDLVEFAADSMGGIDILVNNAGIPMFGYAIDDQSDGVEERADAILNTNLRGYWYAIRYSVPFMKQQGRGSIINISSVRGHLGLADESMYCAVKGAIGMMGKSLAVELAQNNIRVNTISPGAIQVETKGHWIRSRYSVEIQKEYNEKFENVFDQGMRLNQPLGRTGHSEDIGHAAIFLASEEAGFITGADLVIDGGLTSVLAEPGALDLRGLSDYYQKSEELRNWFEKLR